MQRIARAAGGGGHKNAAGCRFIGELSDAKRRFVTELEAAVTAPERASGA